MDAARKVGSHTRRRRKCRMSKLTQREIEIHTAKVCLNEARARRLTHPRFSATLLQWAANARRRAAAAGNPSPAQGELFAPPVTVAWNR